MSGKQLQFSGKIVQVEVRQIVLPNGHSMEMEVIHHPGGSAVLALDAQQRICLLKQYRCVFDDWLWELPAGKRDDGEPPLETAQRELAEEAGVAAEQWTDLGYLYLARELAVTKATNAADEVFEVHWRPLQEAYEMVMAGDITDAKSMISILKCYQL